MNAVDTNVLVYRVDRHEPIKQAKARDLLRKLSACPTPTVMFWQVLAEFVRQLRAWENQGRIKWDTLLRYVGAIRRILPTTMPTPAILDKALDLSARYSLSHWDSMILGACVEIGVDTLYTEDMGAPTSYDGVQLINPFV